MYQFSLPIIEQCANSEHCSCMIVLEKMFVNWSRPGFHIDRSNSGHWPNFPEISGPREGINFTGSSCGMFSNIGLFKQNWVVTWISNNICSFIWNLINCWCHQFNLSRPEQNGRHFADDNFRCIFVNDNFCILIKMSLKFVPNGPIDNNPAFA